MAFHLLMCCGICLPHCSILYHMFPCVLLFIYTQKSACFLDYKMNGVDIYSCSVYCKASIRDVIEKVSAVGKYQHQYGNAVCH